MEENDNNPLIWEDKVLAQLKQFLFSQDDIDIALAKNRIT